ncbi:SbtR family transcriptional regulator [Streptomyces sp. ESR1.13]|uniref:SbtR family transcriptional regulator n=1 Tax=unclassified Streptomyces TaxID=2593676 RepID=UPI004042BF7D
MDRDEERHARHPADAGRVGRRGACPDQGRDLNAIASILAAGRTAGELRPDVTAEEIAAGLIGIFTVARRPGHAVTADRLLDIFLDGLRSQGVRER